MLSTVCTVTVEARPSSTACPGLPGARVRSRQKVSAGGVRLRFALGSTWASPALLGIMRPLARAAGAGAATTAGTASSTLPGRNPATSPSGGCSCFPNAFASIPSCTIPACRTPRGVWLRPRARISVIPTPVAAFSCFRSDFTFSEMTPPSTVSSTSSTRSRTFPLWKILVPIFLGFSMNVLWFSKASAIARTCSGILVTACESTVGTAAVLARTTEFESKLPPPAAKGYTDCGATICGRDCSGAGAACVRSGDAPRIIGARSAGTDSAALLVSSGLAAGTGSSGCETYSSSPPPALMNILAPLSVRLTG
mmetsp:Transcript_26860/g.67639  ORF Transcript_26860/g.67639 Transcript_26860/m.67639 type:complete len:310 (-) Transcript_26860:1797-2726(-)